MLVASGNSAPARAATEPGLGLSGKRCIADTTDRELAEFLNQAQEKQAQYQGHNQQQFQPTDVAVGVFRRDLYLYEDFGNYFERSSTRTTAASCSSATSNTTATGIENSSSSNKSSSSGAPWNVVAMMGEFDGTTTREVMAEWLPERDTEKVLIIPNAGHTLYLEKPALVAEKLSNLLLRAD